MTNEYGVKLDRNGYAPSILQTEHDGFCECHLCKRRSGGRHVGYSGFLADKMDRHEVFGGANREKSKALGLWVNLCHLGCHEGPGSVHDNRDLDKLLKAETQQRAMEEYGWSEEEFIDRFGKSFLAYLPKSALCGCATGAAVPVSHGGFRVLADPDLPF